jgi:hypothetical protein
VLKNTKVVVLVGAVLAVLGVLLLLQEDYRLLGIALLVLAVLGTAGLLWSNAREEADHLEAPDDGAAPPRARADTSTATAEPLATWSAEPLATWSPPEGGTATVDEVDDTFGEDVLDELEALEDVDVVSEVETIDDREVLEPYEAEFDTVEIEELEEVEVVDEDADLLTPIVEDVESADDIMKASAATELKGPAAGENSELAKLLAKVQSRLAAYE